MELSTQQHSLASLLTLETIKIILRLLYNNYDEVQELHVGHNEQVDKVHLHTCHMRSSILLPIMHASLPHHLYTAQHIQHCDSLH